MTQAPFLKRCSKCRKQKWNSSFYKSANYSDGHQSICKDCDNQYRRKQYQLSSKVRCNRQRKYKFGITSKEYELILKSQDNVCAICKQPEIQKRNGKIKQLAVDHCHKTDKIRGLLCYKCNVVLGMVNDDLKILKEMMAYLERNQDDNT